ncbi:MAG: response regulator [Chloroflexi bacterium]|nr:response regulator [Chloroflexota bacterium]
MSSQAHALIIEDNVYNAEVLASLLAAEGVNSTIVLDVSTLENEISHLPHINIIFLDLEMPEANGYEVFQYLTSELKTNTIPIVAYTVHISEINVAKKLGFHSFLGKPLNSNHFANQLQRILSNQPVWEVG